ncbi:unnamed protein product [Effrenium voratum]|uniref:Uncharacterized protein n=1 Tax=Effrenium voratum TaxID=2562239 RepID=A0AA36I554_9DINO|nr:unnamed protein product [Effrenium voratum]
MPVFLTRLGPEEEVQLKTMESSRPTTTGRPTWPRYLHRTATGEVRPLEDLDDLFEADDDGEANMATVSRSCVSLRLRFLYFPFREHSGQWLVDVDQTLRQTQHN